MSRSNGQDSGPLRPGRRSGAPPPGPSLPFSGKPDEPKRKPELVEVDRYGPFTVLQDQDGLYRFNVDGGPRPLTLEEVAKLRAIVCRLYARERDNADKQEREHNVEYQDQEQYRRPGQS